MRGAAAPAFAALVCATAVLATGCGQQGLERADGHTQIQVARSASRSCDLEATPASFAARVSISEPGDTICLATGSYGRWRGTDKQITVTAAPGADPRMTIDLAAGARGFTLNHIGGMGGEIARGASDITIEHAAFTSALVIDGLQHANVTLNADTFENISNPTCHDEPARIHLNYASTTPSGVTVENSFFSGGDTDGIQTGAPLVIKDNVFTDLRSPPSDCNHTDSIQGVGAYGVQVIGNLFDNDYDGAVDYDGSSHWTVLDNACYDIDRRACVTLYADLDSVVEHNTAGTGMSALELDHKPSDRTGQGTVFENNVGALSASDGSTTAVDTHNLFAGATAPNIAGGPTFMGGSSPTSWAGFVLAPSSRGHRNASDGTDVGIRASAGGPETPEERSAAR